MRILQLILFLLPLMWLSCKDEGLVEKTDSYWISTEENSAQGLSELDHGIQGKWELIKSDCAFLDGSTEDWEFNEGLCKWNEFTHTYSIRHDSLFVAGMTFIIQLKGKNLVLHSEDEPCSIHLSAR